MIRTELLAYLNAKYKGLLDVAHIREVDKPEGLQIPMDQAFRRLGAAEGDLPAAESSNVTPLLALADYFLLEHIRAALAASTFVSGTGFTSSRTQVFQQVSDLLEAALARCDEMGYPPVLPSENPKGFKSVRITADYMEP